jgi:hypothetical protein
MDGFAQPERVALLLIAAYLAIIGTWKLRMMLGVCHALKRHTSTLQTHSKRIAAILELVSNLPDGSPAQQAGRRAQLYTIVREAKEEIETEDTNGRPLSFRR